MYHSFFLLFSGEPRKLGAKKSYDMPWGTRNIQSSRIKIGLQGDFSSPYERVEPTGEGGCGGSIRASEKARLEALEEQRKAKGPYNFGPMATGNKNRGCFSAVPEVFGGGPTTPAEEPPKEEKFVPEKPFRPGDTMGRKNYEKIQILE